MAPANAPVEPSLVGAVLSRRYLLKHEIGRGGMAVVYAAERVDGGGPVAIKILHPFFLADELVMTRFLEEGRTCMRLVHPNILRVHECLAAEDGTPYLVMDLLEGVPLSAYTRDGGRVALGRAIPILQGMLAGLEAAHATGIVHRDLKPGNVFLVRTGGVFSVKLLDFGIAKVMDAAGGMGTKTKTGALLGTPAYMSPEQVKSARDVDGRSDLWSVGVMFYEMLTGRIAFPAPTEYARLAAVISAKPVPIESIDPDLAPVAPFIERALEKDRERRFQTAREMALALDAIMPTAPVTRPGEPAPAPPQDESSMPTLSAPMGPNAPGAGWSAAVDGPPAEDDGEPDASTARRPERRPEPLTAEVPANVNLDTLASPKRAAVPEVLHTTRPSPRVVIVPEHQLAAARAREAEGPAVDRSAAPGSRRIGVPAVASLVALAFAAGLAVGLVVGHTP